MTIKVPDAPPRRQDKSDCPVCHASAKGCASNEWLRGRKCCTACRGNHDAQTTTTGVNVTGPGDDSKEPPTSTSRPMAASASTFPRPDLPAPVVEPNQNPRSTT